MSICLRRRARALAALVLLLAALGGLAGCSGGLLPAPPERQLYRPIPVVAFPVGLPHLPMQLLVATATAPAALDTDRIALSRTPVSLEYYAASVWTDRVPYLVRDALVAGFDKSGAVAAVAPEGTGVRGEFVLDPTVDEFQAIYDSPNGPPLARVKLELKLVRIVERKIVAHISVSAEARAASPALPDVVQAFGAALGGAVQQAVLWTVGNPGLSARR